MHREGWIRDRLAGKALALHLFFIKLCGQVIRLENTISCLNQSMVIVCVRQSSHKDSDLSMTYYSSVTHNSYLCWMQSLFLNIPHTWRRWEAIKEVAGYSSLSVSVIAIYIKIFTSGLYKTKHELTVDEVPFFQLLYHSFLLWTTICLHFFSHFLSWKKKVFDLAWKGMVCWCIFYWPISDIGYVKICTELFWCLLCTLCDVTVQTNPGSIKMHISHYAYLKYRF